MKLKFLCVLLIVNFNCWAAYNSNMRSEVTGVYVYADIDHIYFTLKNPPATHPECNPRYFVIDGSLPSDRRQMLLSRLMLAYATKENLNIGFDSLGSCIHGYIRVHRVG